MIEILFEYMGEIILVNIDGNRVLFGTQTFGAQLSDIEGLRLDYEGVIEEHPDLKGNDDWKKIAIQRFKEYIKKLNHEDAIFEYVLHELKKMGYIPIKSQRSGHRPTNL